MESFAAFAGAGVPPGLARKGRADETDRLGTDVLEFESAGVEFGGDEKVLIAGVGEGVWEGGEEGSGGIRLMRFMRGMRVMIELGGEFRAGAGTGPEPEFGRGLEGAGEGGGDFHFVGEPVGDGASD